MYQEATLSKTIQELLEELFWDPVAHVLKSLIAFIDPKEYPFIGLITQWQAKGEEGMRGIARAKQLLPLPLCTDCEEQEEMCEFISGALNEWYLTQRTPLQSIREAIIASLLIHYKLPMECSRAIFEEMADVQEETQHLIVEIAQILKKVLVVKETSLGAGGGGKASERDSVESHHAVDSDPDDYLLPFITKLKVDFIQKSFPSSWKGGASRTRRKGMPSV